MSREPAAVSSDLPAAGCRLPPDHERLIERIATETARRLVASPSGMSIAGTGVDREDLVMEARIACLRALRTYDSARGTKLTTWMVSAARGAVLEGLRQADILTRSERTRYREMCRQSAAQEEAPPPPPRALLSYEGLIGEERDEEDLEPPALLDRLGEEDPTLSALPDTLAIEAAFDALKGRVSPAAILVATWHLREEATLWECAARLKLSHSRAGQLLDEARRVLQQALSGGWLPPREPKRQDCAWVGPFLAAVRRGCSDALACRIAGIDRRRPFAHRQRHSEFALLLERAREEGGRPARRGQWQEPFLAQVRAGVSTRDACERLRIQSETPGRTATRDRKFSMAWAAAREAARRRKAA